MRDEVSIQVDCEVQTEPDDGDLRGIERLKDMIKELEGEKDKALGERNHFKKKLVSLKQENERLEKLSKSNRPP